MKLAYLATAHSNHSIRWIKYFVRQGHEIVWISLAPPIDEAQALLNEAPERIHFYEIIPSPLADINGAKGMLYLPAAVWKCLKILKKEKPDLLHLHSAGTYGLTGALTGFHPLVLTPWGSDILLNTGYKKTLVKYVVRKSDYYTCDGKNTFEKLVELGADPKKIELIRFGVEMEKFAKVRAQRKSGESVRIISLRTLEPVYNLETLIRAAALVLKEAPRTEFTIAGGGVEKEMLENLAKELGIETRINFTGRYNADNLPEMLKNADIYVSTALSDSGLSASTAEAMASGLPAAVTDSGDNLEWIDNNFVVPIKNPQKLAEGLLYLINHENERRLQGEKNFKTIDGKNNYSREMDKVEKIYFKFRK